MKGRGDLMLQIQNLHVEKNGMAICRVPKLDASPGERHAIIGPNGSGKTTLLRVLGGLERDFSGECNIEPTLRQRVYVHQIPYLFRGTVMFNVGYGLVARKVAKQERLSTVRHWLKTFGLGSLAGRRCDKLSGGERRRVALARAFAIRADLILLDEPLADLDQEGIEIVCKAINEATAATIVITSPVPLPSTLTLQTHFLPKR